MAFPVLLIGVCLAVVASIISNLGLNLQKRNHLNNSHSVEAQRSGEKAAQQQTQPQHPTPHSHRRQRSAAAASAAGDVRRSHRVQPSDILVKSSAASGGAGDAAPSVRKRSGRRKKGRKGRREATGERALLLPEGGAQRVNGSAAAVSSYRSLADSDMTDSHIAELLSASASSSFLVAPHASTAGRTAAPSPSSPSRASRTASSSSSAPLPPAPAATNHRSADEAAASINYTRQLVWQCGLALVILGSIFDFAALAFAPQSVIAPLGSLTLVSNVFLAPLLLKERLSRRDVLCTLIIVGGAALAVGCASNGDREVTVQQMFRYFLHLQFLVYAVLVVVSVLALRVMTWKAAVLRKRAHSSAAAARQYATGMRYHRFGYAAAAGIMGAQSVLFAKCTSTLFRSTLAGEGVMFGYWQTYLVLLGLGVTIFFQIRWLNSGLRLFPALYVVPVFQSFWILVSVVSGMVFFQEYQGVLDLPLNAFGFCTGLLVTIGGVYVLSQKGGQQQQQPHDSAPQQQQAAAAGAEIEVSEGPTQRRQSVSSSLSSSFDASAPLHLNGERDSLSAELQRERSGGGGADAAAAAQPLSFKQPLLADEEKEAAGSGHVSITMTPARSRRRPDAASSLQQHSAESPPLLTEAIGLSPAGHGPHHLSPLPEMLSSPSSPRSRARGDSDPLERHHASEPPLSAASAARSPVTRVQSQLPSQSWLRPPTVEIEPVLPSHSFSHREEFLQTPPPPPLQSSPSFPGPPSSRRARSASIGHIGEEVRSFFSQSRSRGRKALTRAAKRFSISAALSSLMPDQEADAAAAAALLLGQSPHFRRPSWQQLSANAAMTAPALSAFAHAFALRNYERTDGEADADSPRGAGDDAKQAEGEDEDEDGRQPDLEAGEAGQEGDAGDGNDERSDDEDSEDASGDSGQEDEEEEEEEEEEKTQVQGASAAAASPAAYKPPSPSRFAAPQSPPSASIASTASSSLSSPLISSSSSSSSPSPARLPLQQTHSVRRPQRR